MLESGGEMRQQSFVIETKNGSRKRLKVRRLKYTCQTKVEVEITGGHKEYVSSELKREEKDVGVPVKVLSVSFSSTENDIVLSSSSGSGSEERRKTSGGESLERLGRGTYGVVSVQGRRKVMEDAVRAEVGFAVNGSRGKFDFFGVYDGHGGAVVARACRDRMHEVVAEAVELERINNSSNNNNKKDPVDWDWERVMEGCFGKMDEEVSGIAAARTVGATAVVAVVTEDQVVVGNCGDCRAVLSRGGVALALSSDHKPDRVDELKRIEAAGGKVINWNGNRVLGVLATSRSIGDKYMRPYVISKPEVTVTKRTEEDEFLILASDGLWDVISNEMACRVVNKCLDGRIRRISTHGEDHVQSHTASEAAAVLADLAMARGSKDNISVIVVALSKTS
ncbi:protein phosphatase 2C 51-like [Prunus dulcis]|uniref:protein phosphatase 2C 51-like n=1 Tax=Prunus dulcis TaxID=3755 RepID=UPI00148302B9|nr:protein phosphatase 2C 51-like [Prunus dulcis]